MPAIVDTEKCVASGDCIESCPTEAIEIQDNVAVVDDDTCSDCGVCEDSCPTGAITIE